MRQNSVINGIFGDRWEAYVEPALHHSNSISPHITYTQFAAPEMMANVMERTQT